MEKDKQYKRRSNLLYHLRKKGYKCLTKEKIIFCPYKSIPHEIYQIKALCGEFFFSVQYEMTE